MSRTFIRQDTQIRNSDTYDDTIAPSLANFETNATQIENDLNALRSAAHDLLKRRTGNWYDGIATPGTFEGGAQRAVDDLNQDLHDLERKRVLKCIWNLDAITVPGAQNYVVLGAGELPGNTTAAVGAVQTLGTVVAFHAGTFGTHSLDEVGGATAISPKNLVEIVDSSTRDPILDASGRRVYALLQSEVNTDGHTINTTNQRTQLSFVVVSGNDLIACAVADITGKVVDYCYVERVGLEDLTEQDFLGGAAVDVPSGANVTRQVAYDNQGATPVNLTTNAVLDLEGAGLYWEIRDDLEATLFRVTDGSAGGTSTVQVAADVDTFDVDAAVNDFLQGVTVDSGGTSINLGVTAGQIDSAGALTLASAAAGDLTIDSAGEILFDDVNRPGSFSAPIKLSDVATDWSDYETTFGGEIPILRAITEAAKKENRTKSTAVVNVATVAPDTDVGGSGGGANLDAQLADFSAVASFQDNVDVFLNGQLLRGDNSTTGANNHDVYPGTSAALGQLKFEFQLKINDVITMIVYGEQ